MNLLKAYSINGKKVIDSREVADMIGRTHKELLRTINTYMGYLKEDGAERKIAPGDEIGGQRNFAPSDFFIPSTYINEQNKEMPCYLITKKGCDMIANKLTGKKGVLFTAAYVTAFEDMTEQLANRTAPNVSPGGVAQLINVTRRIMIDSGDTPQAVRQMERNVLETWCIPVPPPLQYPAQLDLFSADYQQMIGEGQT